MKSKLNDAELIAEAYANVEPIEVQEEGLGALAGGIGRGIAAAGRGLKKAATSDTTKKIVKGAGNLAKDVAKEAGAVAAEVGGEGLKVAGKAATAAGKKLAGDEEGDWPAADHDAPKGGIGSRSMDREAKLKAKVDDAEAKGDIDKSDATSIMRSHHNSEDAEHDAPIEVDMSDNPSPESLEVSKDVDVEEEPAVAIVAPSIQPSAEAERVNHHDDSEVKMALAELYKIEKYAFALGLMMKETKALEGWTAAKITKAADYLGSVFHKLDYDFHADATDHGDIAPEDHEGH